MVLNTEVTLDIMDNFKKSYIKPLYTKDMSEYGQICCIEVSQFDWSQDVILLGFVNKILLGYLKFTDIVEVEIISEFPFPCRCSCLSISMETNISALPSVVLFCAAGTDFKIRVIQTDLSDDSSCKVLTGHSDYINDVKFDSENKYLASVSDDNTVRIWEVENYRCINILHLNFPGLSIQWHRNDVSKFLVADKVGMIKLYHMETLKPVITIDTGKTLSACHWSPSNSQMVASLQLGELSVWDMSVPSTPKLSTLIFTEAGGYLKFCPQGEFVAALNPLERNLKVVKLNSQEQQFSTFMKLPTNFCWHFKYPIICAGDDNKLCVWKINTV
ncbi:hypothetical protein WA026_020788 [Henosepilachna vigintioctopunctata]|uniref:Nucleoporin Nup37 n=1 Tax=Henosepilachna vigintioctopunctata TaxID=420089 RepID=A0AAW1TXD3_9CUCU